MPGGEKATPGSLFSLGKPVINVRAAEIGPAGDDGMIDIFRVDRLVPECGELFERERRNEFLLGALRKASGVRYEPRPFNFYYNRGVTATRGYHADGFGPKVKSFLYLNDVSTNDDGPYCFGLGTHDNLALPECNVDLHGRFEA